MEDLDTERSCRHLKEPRVAATEAREHTQPRNAHAGGGEDADRGKVEDRHANMRAQSGQKGVRRMAKQKEQICPARQ